ncbi:MAG: sucrase ferredoxin [Myxococcales bacterium]|nr:sucrase ferredoxin [Myxococcales bacterium]
MDSCSAESLGCGEPIAGSAVADADRLVCVEYRGHWERDVAGFALGGPARAALDACLARLPRTRLQFVRRTGPGVRHAADAPLAVFAATVGRAGRTYRAELGSLDALAALDLDRLFAGATGEARERPLFLVCTHGRRDACCARHGAAFYHALAAELGPDAVWESTHQGGHRYAATVLELPSGRHHGRLAPGDAAPFARAHAAGRLYALDRYRGRVGEPPAAQVAEAWLRADTGVLEHDAVRLLEVRADADGRHEVRLELAGREHRLTLVRRAGEGLRRASCGAEPEPWRRYAVVGH